MTDAEIYLRAAEKIATGKMVGACWAIMKAVEPQAHCLTDLPQHDLLVELFQPPHSDDDYFDNVYWGNNFSEDPNERRNCRVTMLLLMSEIVGGTL